MKNPNNQFSKCCVCGHHFIPHKVGSVDFCSEECFQKYTKNRLQDNKSGDTNGSNK